MFTINFIFFTVTIARREKNEEQIQRDYHVANMMRKVQEQREEYTRFL
jgi:uncharacterized protein (TIGR02413 family)